MPALNIEFTETEMAQIRDTATREGQSMKNIAHEAVLAELHRRRVAAAAVRVTRISSGLNERLADK